MNLLILYWVIIYKLWAAGKYQTFGLGKYRACFYQQVQIKQAEKMPSWQFRN